jgi:hypothetical protein
MSESLKNSEALSLGFLQSGEQVYDRPDSHLNEHPVQPRFIKEALSRIDAKQRLFVKETVRFDEIIGDSICVSTLPEDEIVFARRPKRLGLTRFVKNRLAEPTNEVTIILRWDKMKRMYKCLTAYAGGDAPAEPWDSNATSDSQEFWNTHALVWGSQEIDDENISN